MAFSITIAFNFPLFTFRKEGTADENKTVVIRLSGTVRDTLMHR